MVFTIIISVLGLVLAMISLFKDKWSTNEKRKNKTLIVSAFLLVGACFFSILSENKKTKANLAQSLKRESESAKALQKADSTLNGIQATFNSLNKLKDTTQVIVDSMRKQFVMQKKLNASTQLLNQKSEQLYITQKATLKNVNEILTPFFPCDLNITIKISLNHKEYAELKKKILIIRDSFDTNSDYNPSDVLYRKVDPQIDSIGIMFFSKFDNRFLDFKNENDNLITNRQLGISFLSLDELDYILSRRGNYSYKDFEGKNHFSINTIFDNVKTYKSSARLYLSTMSLYLFLTYKNFEPQNVHPFLDKFSLNVKNLTDYNLLFSHAGFNQHYALLDISITPHKTLGKGFEMQPSEKKTLYNSEGGRVKIYYGKINLIDTRDKW